MVVKLLKLPAVLKRVTISRTRLQAQIKEGTFPAPVNLGGRAIAWVEKDVDEWVNAMVQASRQSGGKEFA